MRRTLTRATTATRKQPPPSGAPSQHAKAHLALSTLRDLSSGTLLAHTPGAATRVVANCSHQTLDKISSAESRAACLRRGAGFFQRRHRQAGGIVGCQCISWFNHALLFLLVVVERSLPVQCGAGSVFFNLQCSLTLLLLP